VGQLMHLVEDASVPLHTRNDAHLIFNYETWVEKFRTDKENPQNQDKVNEWIADDNRC
jgi:hypothetical protein